MLSKLKLTLGCWNYDRTRALMDGSVRARRHRPELPQHAGGRDVLPHAAHREFDVAEMSLSSYTVSLFRTRGRSSRSRCFRRASSGIPASIVNANAGISDAEGSDRQAGRRARVPDDGAGLDPRHPVRPLRRAGRQRHLFHRRRGRAGPAEKKKLDLPANIRVEAIPDDKTLSQMLRDGEIDALYTARTPSTLRRRDACCGCSRIIVEVERDYFRKTGIFPIMHTVAIRREVYEDNRWIAQSLFKAFLEAQRRTYEDLRETAALKAMLPWLNADMERRAREMGDDYWPYGLERNRETLATFLRYHYEQGLSKRLLKPEELFAPETLESFKI